jgi:hypothetical protein
VDFDSAKDTAAALAEARQLLRQLAEVYDVPARALGLYFSGMKGFAVLIPAALFGGFAPSTDAAKYVGQIVQKLTVGLRTVDHSIYDLTRLLRLPNTRHSRTGLYKIPLTPTEFLTLTIDEIKVLATTPREPNQADPDDWGPRPELIALRNETAATRQLEARQSGPRDGRQYPPANLNRSSKAARGSATYEMTLSVSPSHIGTGCCRSSDGAKKGSGLRTSGVNRIPHTLEMKRNGNFDVRLRKQDQRLVDGSVSDSTVSGTAPPVVSGVASKVQ